jgi:hypothetical protein
MRFRSSGSPVGPRSTNKILPSSSSASVSDFQNASYKVFKRLSAGCQRLSLVTVVQALLGATQVVPVAAIGNDGLVVASVVLEDLELRCTMPQSVLHLGDELRATARDQHLLFSRKRTSPNRCRGCPCGGRDRWQSRRQPIAIALDGEPAWIRTSSSRAVASVRSPCISVIYELTDAR